MIEVFNVKTNKFYDKDGKEFTPSLPELITFSEKINNLVVQEVAKKQPKGNVSLGSKEIE